MIHPIDTRYSTKEMQKIFSEKNILKKKLDVEVSLAYAYYVLKKISKEDFEKIENAANKVNVKEVKEVEKETKHDIMAIVKVLAKKSGRAGKYVHLGATSYDIVDTAWALILRDAINVIERELLNLKKILIRKIKKYKDLVIVGRTHGQHAAPITLGLKFSVYLVELERNLKRLKNAKEVISFGKMNGAVGTGAAFFNCEKIQKIVMKRLKLNEPLVTTQVLQRDRHAEVIFVLALIGQLLEKIAKEIRNLQRTEIGEVEEPFFKKQVGSSTLPQKRNPWRSERICGLSRFLRSNVITALENIPLEHERDLTNSSCERILFPECFTICHFMLKEMQKILDGLIVYKKNIKRNLSLTKGRLMAEALMVKLVEKGVSRQEAHEIVRNAAMISFKEKIEFFEVLRKNEKIKKYLTLKEIEETLKPENYLGATFKFIDKVLKSV